MIENEVAEAILLSIFNQGMVDSTTWKEIVQWKLRRDIRERNLSRLNSGYCQACGIAQFNKLTCTGMCVGCEEKLKFEV